MPHTISAQRPDSVVALRQEVDPEALEFDSLFAHQMPFPPRLVAQTCQFAPFRGGDRGHKMRQWAMGVGLDSPQSRLRLLLLVGVIAGGAALSL